MERTLVSVIALVIVGVFLASLIIAIQSVPLTIIAVAIFALMAYDFFEDARERYKTTRDRDPGSRSGTTMD